VDKLHITQDDYGYWMLSLEKADGTLGLLAHQFQAPDKLIETANDLIKEGKVTATLIVDPPRTAAVTAETPPQDYTKPAPRKAGA
jgi:hypothetical protein